MKRLMMILAGAVFMAMATGPTPAAAKVIGKNVKYTADGVAMKGYLAYDSALKGKAPGVLVVHEWWGHNAYARSRARMLAELGYTALAVDMYGHGKKAAHPDDAAKFSSDVMKNFDTAGARFTAAAEFLKKQPTVDPGRIAAIGYCFGGGVVLNMARQGADLRGVASFHGSLAAAKPAKPGAVKAKIRVYNGADDKFVPAGALEAFRKEMVDAQADFRIINYPGAVHSFTNPGATKLGRKYNLPLAYHADSDRKSWEDMKHFLREIFSNKAGQSGAGQEYFQSDGSTQKVRK